MMTPKTDSVAVLLCQLNGCTEPCEQHRRWAERIAALSAQGEEPVAWMHRSDIAFLKDNPDEVQAAYGERKGANDEPLYLHPARRIGG